MFKKNKIALSVGASVLGAIGIISSAQAVHINPDGTGQVLIFPYYNAHEGYVTNINLVNSTDQTKAVKIHFRESKTSKDMLDFNVYLSPYDVWTATVRKSEDSDVGSIVTNDRSCTFPVDMAASCDDGNCETIRKFPGSDVLGQFGVTDADTREGYVEVIEMGVVNDPSVQHGVLHNNGEPNDCNALNTAWRDGSFTEGSGVAARGMSAPTGGLFGHSAVLNVTKGTAFAVAPVTIEDYSTEAQHYRPDNPVSYGLPSLASGNVKTSTVLYGSQMIETTWKPFGYDVCLFD